MWHLRVLDNTSIVPSFQKLVFRDNDTPALLIEILRGAVEPRSGVQIRRFVPPRLLYKILQGALRNPEYNQFEDLFQLCLQMIAQPPSRLFDIMNGLGNALCIDGRLGELREEFVVSCILWPSPRFCYDDPK